MIYKEQIKQGLKDVEIENFISNKAILRYLENIAGHHSDSVGYGINSMKNTNRGWVVLEWKIKILKRIEYGQDLSINTWSRSVEKCYGIRDFEIYDEKGNLSVIATSKWLLIDTQKGSITKADEMMKTKYDSEINKSVFVDENFEKIDIPVKFDKEIEYEVKRRDIDFMGHVHNLYYLDFAYEVLPDEIYKKRLFDNIRISYKKEIKYGEIIKCKYAYIDNKNIIVIENKDAKINAVIELY